MSKELRFGDDARQQMIAGVNDISRCSTSNYGPTWS